MLILTTSLIQLIIFTANVYYWYTLVLGMISLAFAVKLGLLGKHLLDVILPGTYVRRKKKPTKYNPKGAAEKIALKTKVGAKTAEPEVKK